jgi:hypothetical protein
MCMVPRSAPSPKPVYRSPLPECPVTAPLTVRLDPHNCIGTLGRRKQFVQLGDHYISLGNHDIWEPRQNAALNASHIFFKHVRGAAFEHPQSSKHGFSSHGTVHSLCAMASRIGCSPVAQDNNTGRHIAYDCGGHPFVHECTVANSAVQMPSDLLVKPVQ